MSVWTRVKTEVLSKNVDMDIFVEAIKDLDLELDFSRTRISNYYGHEKVDAAFKFKKKDVNLGIIKNKNKGLEIAGDTWQSGIVKDNQHDKLVNMISQVYQSHKLKKDLELAGWDVVVTKKDNKIELESTMW